MLGDNAPKAQPQNIIENSINMATFCAEIAKLVDERRKGLQMKKEFAENLRRGLGLNGVGKNTQIELEIIERWKKLPNRPPEDMSELLNVGAEELTEEDAEMWEKIKNYRSKPVTKEEFFAYRDKVIKSNNRSRGNFLAVMANKINGLWYF